MHLCSGHAQTATSLEQLSRRYATLPYLCCAAEGSRTSLKVRMTADYTTQYTSDTTLAVSGYTPLFGHVVNNTAIDFQMVARILLYCREIINNQYINHPCPPVIVRVHDVYFVRCLLTPLFFAPHPLV